LSPKSGFQVIGVIIYIIRFAPKLIRVNWLGHNSSRFFAISVLFVVVNIALTVYLHRLYHHRENSWQSSPTLADHPAGSLNFSSV